MTSRSLFSVEAIVLDLGERRLVADLQDLGRLGLVAAGLAQDLLDHLGLDGPGGCAAGIIEAAVLSHLLLNNESPDRFLSNKTFVRQYLQNSLGYPLGHISLNTYFWTFQLYVKLFSAQINALRLDMHQL